MSVNNEQQICPKHRIVMKNGTCRMCQAEFYDEHYRIYGKKEDKPEKEKRKKVWSKEQKPVKKKKKAFVKTKNRPITNDDLKKLMDKFNNKK